MRMSCAFRLLVPLLLFAPLQGLAQSTEGPPPPVAPAVVSRDETGRATIRAVRAVQPWQIDGALDEPFYRDVAAISDFTQVGPEYGAPAAARTEVWLAF